MDANVKHNSVVPISPRVFFEKANLLFGFVWIRRDFIYDSYECKVTNGVGAFVHKTPISNV